MSASREQTKALEQQLFLSFLRSLVLYLLLWAVIALGYRFLVRDRLARYVLETTTTPFVVSMDDYRENFWDSSQYLLERMDAESATIRSLFAYERVHSLKYPVVVGAFLLGIVAILLRLMRRSLDYFERLGDGVADMVYHRREPVRLPGELAIMQSELNEMREAMLENEQRALESERRKNELVAYLAHDLRTPLTSVVGYLSLLSEAPGLPEEQRKEYVAIALDKAETLDALTDEFFEITRYNLSSIPIERDDVDIEFFLEQIADEFYPEMQARSIDARVTAPDGESFYVDSDKMARAIGNVVRNAIAYAHPGTTVGIDAERRGDAPGWAIRISNHGREIAPEHLERIFDQFMRTDSARKQDGHAGLGLAIAREIVQAHGGSIRAESAEGLTTFTIELP